MNLSFDFGWIHGWLAGSNVNPSVFVRSTIWHNRRP